MFLGGRTRAAWCFGKIGWARVRVIPTVGSLVRRPSRRVLGRRPQALLPRGRRLPILRQGGNRLLRFPLSLPLESRKEYIQTVTMKYLLVGGNNHDLR